MKYDKGKRTAEHGKWLKKEVKWYKNEMEKKKI
jgi:hypothetical protein